MRRRSISSLADQLQINPGDMSATAQVKAAIGAAAMLPRPAKGDRRFVFDAITPRERTVGPLLGVYLGFAVARLHERFPVLQVPYLLWGLMSIMLITVAMTVPGAGWRAAWKASPQLRLVGLLTLLAIVTVPLGVWIGGSLDFLINRYTIALAVYVACLMLLRDRGAMRRVVALFVLMTTVVAVRNTYGYFNHDLSDTLMSAEQKAAYLDTGVTSPDAMRQTFGSLDPNDIAAVMATTLPLALWLAIGSVRRRVLWTPCAVALVAAVIPTASRGGLLGLVAVAIVLIGVGTHGAKRVLLAGTLVIGAVAFNVIAGAQMDRMSNFDGSDYNYTAGEGRIAIWKRGIVWMIRRPWGYGLDNFPVYFGWLNGRDRSAHNSLIQYGVELGVAGLAAYLLICGTLVKSLLKIRRNAIMGGPGGRETATLCGYVLAMLAACWTTGFFLSNAYYPLTYMAIGIASAVVLSKVEAKEPSAAAASAPVVPASRMRRRQFKAFQTA